MMKLWGGGFKEDMDPEAWKLNASIGFDQRLVLEDIRASIAWAKGLENAGVMTMDECQKISMGLREIQKEVHETTFVILETDEDIHSAVERRLGELIGPLAGKLHTGRSRNDQVATDFRLWMMGQLPDLVLVLKNLQGSLIKRAKADLDIIMPGYTHLQRAQPILLSHWWMSHFWPLQRDKDRFAEMYKRLAILPLGSAALAGTSIRVDRDAIAKDLGFLQTSNNSIDSVSDRDFVAEFLFIAALTGVHLSRLAESLILFSSAEFGFIELSDAFSTGSSLMPQKKNPDIFELARGKAGGLIGILVGFLTTLKGLPSAYDKDLQEDKPAVFEAFDTLVAIADVMSDAVLSLNPSKEKMAQAIDPTMMATDLADFLVEQGVPFREAHAVVSKIVRESLEESIPLEEFPLRELLPIDPSAKGAIKDVFNPQHSISKRTVKGGTSKDAVENQIRIAEDIMLEDNEDGP